MIETKQAIENLDEIVSVPGVDVAYVGPADLSVSLGFPAAPYHEDPAYATPVAKVLEACQRHGVVPGFHGGNTLNAQARIDQGFRFVEVCGDADALVRTAASDLKAMRGSAVSTETTA